MHEAARRHHHGPVAYDDFLAIEEANHDVRHELVGGTLHALADGSRRHNQIALRAAARLMAAAGDGQCQVYAADVKLRVASDTVYYPDVMAVCDPADTDPLVVTHPCLVVEILSPSTAAIDRREKMIAYRLIPTLQAYLIIDHDETRVERHWRDTLDSVWQIEIVTSGTVSLPCVREAALALSALYDGLPSTDTPLTP